MDESQKASANAERLLRLCNDLPLREGLVDAFRDMLAHAGELAAREQTTKQSIRLYRKSLRRARALVVLCRDMMPRSAYKQIVSRLRVANRATSAHRDSDMLMGLLGKLRRKGQAEDAVAALRSEIRSKRRSLGADQRRVIVLCSTAGIADLPELFDEALGLDTSWEQVSEGLAKTYRAARKAMRKSQKSAELDLLHDWRKRTKELNHQVELLTSGEGCPISDTAQTYAKLAKQLGQITDLLALRKKLEDSSIGSNEASRLDKTARHRTRDLLPDCYATGVAAFPCGPRKWAHEIVGQVREGREG